MKKLKNLKKRSKPTHDSPRELKISVRDEELKSYPLSNHQRINHLRK